MFLFVVVPAPMFRYEWVAVVWVGCSCQLESGAWSLGPGVWSLEPPRPPQPPAWPSPSPLRRDETGCSGSGARCRSSGHSSSGHSSSNRGSSLSHLQRRRSLTTRHTPPVTVAVTKVYTSPSSMNSLRLGSKAPEQQAMTSETSFGPFR